MTTGNVHPGDDPRGLLSGARQLTRRVRRDQRATWFPLLVLAALTFISLAARRYSGHHLDCLAVPPGGRICMVYSGAQFVYWPIALVLGYVATASFYIRRSRARGVGTRVRPYAITGIITAIALTSAALWELHNPPAGSLTGLNGLEWGLTSPGTAISLALLVLAWAERNRALLLLTLAYLAAVIAPIAAGVVRNPPWYSLPAVIQGIVLLLGGIGFALAQRPLRSPAP